MATTTGLVQLLSVASGAACVWIGPRADNAEILTVSSDGTSADTAFAGSLIQMLTAASTNFREVIATHGDNDAKITALQIDPV